MYFSLLVHPPDVETVLLSLFFLFLFFNALQGDNNNNNTINDLGHNIVVWALPRVHPNLYPTAWAKMTLSRAQFYSLL